MALCMKSLRTRSIFANFLLKPVCGSFAKSGARIVYRTKLENSICKYSIGNKNSILRLPPAISFDTTRFLSSKDDISEKENEPKKLTIMQRFKQMYRDYVYVLVPVHLVTSAIWIGGFYYLVKSGVDVIYFMETIGIPEKIIKPMRDSTAGFYALTYALYKIATPLRYTVTLGGTTLIINKLIALGIIKPANTKGNIKQMMMEKKEDMQNAYNETKQGMLLRRDQIKERKFQVMEDYKRYKKEIQDIKNSQKFNK